jgi:hypothetical protein
LVEVGGGWWRSSSERLVELPGKKPCSILLIVEPGPLRIRQKTCFPCKAKGVSDLGKGSERDIEESTKVSATPAR